MGSSSAAAGKVPRVSVGLPVYNGAAYLDQALASLTEQAFVDFEVVISDNASTDGTETICREWLARDDRIRYERQSENRGAAWNFNRVFELARGGYFRWAAHDDLVLPGHLEACVEALDADEELVLVHTLVKQIDDDGAFIQRWPFYTDVASGDPIDRLRNVLFLESKCLPVFGLVRSEILAQTRLIGPFDSSDRVLLGELALRGKFGLVDRELFVHRDHSKSSIRAYAGRYERGVWFDPQNAQGAYLPHWRYLTNWLLMVRRVLASGPMRWRSYALLARWAFRNWKYLAYDPVRAVIERVNRTAGLQLGREWSKP